MHLSFDPAKSFRVTEYSDCALRRHALSAAPVILNAAHHVFK